MTRLLPHTEYKMHQHACFSQNKCNFAADILLLGQVECLPTHRSRLFLCLYVPIYGSVPPCGTLMRPLLPQWSMSTGKAGPFFISGHKTNFLQMTYAEKPCFDGDNRAHQTTPTERNPDTTPATADLERQALKDFIGNDYVHKYRSTLLELYTTFVKHSENAGQEYLSEITYHFQVFWWLLDDVEKIQAQEWEYALTGEKKSPARPPEGGIPAGISNCN